MKILDRYIMKLFVINLVILGLVMIALVLLLDLIMNFDEFAAAGERLGRDSSFFVATLRAIVDFYGPWLALLFVYIAGLLPIGAAGFTLASLIRNRELVAMLAGGVSLFRIAMPVLILGFAVNALLFVDQEFIIPRLAYKIARSHSDIKYGAIQPFSPRFVPDGNDALFTAARFDARTETMEHLTILQRDPQGRTIARITASQAVWDEANDRWELINGFATFHRADPERGHEVPFIATDLDPTALVLRQNANFRQLLSLRQLDDLLQRSRVVDVEELTRIRHSRFSMPVMNMMILAMGLPFFLLREPARNLLIQSIKALCVCVGAWAGGFVMLQMVGVGLPPPAIAWLPVLLYLPAAFYLMETLET